MASRTRRGIESGGGTARPGGCDAESADPCGAERELRAVRAALAAKSQELEAMQANLDALVDGVDDAVILLDAEGLVTHVNPAAQHITGWRYPEARGHRAAQVFALDGDVFDVMTTRPATHGVLCNKRGLDVSVEFSVTALRGRQGKPAGAAVVFRDLTGRRAAAFALQATELCLVANEEALFEEQELGQVTLNSIGDAVLRTDCWGRISSLNIVAEKMIDRPLREVVGRQLDEVFPLVDADTGEPVPGPVVRARVLNRTVSLETTCLLVRRSGAGLAVQVSAAPIHDRDGAVIGAVMVAHDVTEARAQSDKLAKLALHDGLTDMPNRALLADRLAQSMEMAQRKGHSLALLYVDIDRFKHINDSLGHAVGDQLLCSVAQRLLGGIRSTDTVSRPGGDEFIVLLTELMHAHDAVICAEKLLRSVGAPHHLGGQELHITASIGIATFPEDALNAATLIGNAELALYQAKHNGRNGLQCFKPSMNAHAGARHDVETALRRAVERHEFFLVYQPKVNLANGDIAGVEALIRWRHPQRGLMSPGQFIAIAEESGLIVPIGRWAFAEICRQAAEWQRAGLPQIPIAVNVSPVELRATAFFATVRDMLQQCCIEPGRVEMELTETFLMQDWESTAQVLRALKTLGLRIALDDFGTGYSSLSYMKRFPIDTLKIDQSFVRDLTQDAGDASIVNALISMGRNLHMEVVAEGIETREQLAFLRDQQCPGGQGYYFCPPLPGSQLGALLHAQAHHPVFAEKIDNRQVGLALAPG